ncbi:MAG: hypothetical protein HZC47_07250 [Methanobacterium sp.]|uniref:hypothetical protein n=1 Tax=Methanobacterium sp. TaxID=2164 RepID=UPI003D6594B8|nr:hypothetical protein [Methanobacterium sp.]
MLKRLINKLSLILVFILFINSLGLAYGAGLQATPAQFKFNTDNSKTIKDTVTVTNTGKEPINIIIDNKRLLKDNINLVYSDEGIATWINVEVNNFTLKPGESKKIPFSITIPSKINYYDAVGGLIIKGSPSTPQNNSNALIPKVEQKIELIIPIFVGLPGPIIESLQLKEHIAPLILISFMPGEFIYPLNNNGTVSANITGNVEINGWINNHNVPINGEIFPGDNSTLKAKWEPGFSDFGIYDTKTTINYGRYQQSKTIVTNDRIIVIPVWLIILLLLFILIGVIKKENIKIPFKIKIEKK